MPHSKQLRLGRFSEDQRVYLLTATVEKREPIFADFQLGRLLIAELRAAHCDGLVESLAWVVMPDHLHWLLVLQRGSISELMRRVKGRSARQINSLAHRSGRLWQDGFHDHALRHEEDVLPVARYIVANPLRAGLVKRVGDYPLWDAVWL
ncbi:MULTISPECIES: REP-associated tyrosine transposase [Pseudomonas]|uniref:Transposase n=1 Tax=Pseudomonas spirodelae TaxID=3101751 RepID=A0ABU5PD27_9PSED|nr:MULTISPECIES: transposase [unclassified Pseudomonas]MBU0901061.1 transposase [Gammaproteobacteria bacterium]MDD2159127.1 transposase [Pseudomonas sp. MIL19]MEA1607591.1 transposase [Pseudomonas sp. T5W1]